MRARGAGDRSVPDTSGHCRSSRGLDAEIYNPSYFTGRCPYPPVPARDCFRPIYALHCLDSTEPTYGAPIAFWTDAFADQVNSLAPDAIAAPSVVWGFSPVFFEESQVRPGIEHILFDVWKLPRTN